jgi:hypothetical protein
MRGHLIIISPGFRQKRQIRLKHSTLAVAGTALLSGLCALVAFGVTFPHDIEEAEFRRMQAENVSLRLEHETADSEARRLKNQVARMEEISNKITRELSAD